jgi:hypothetical protein
MVKLSGDGVITTHKQVQLVRLSGTDIKLTITGDEIDEPNAIEWATLSNNGRRRTGPRSLAENNALESRRGLCYRPP